MVGYSPNTVAESAPGSFQGLPGPIRVGKTTLLSLLAGWQEPGSGTIDWSIPAPDQWENVAVVPQSLGLLPELTLGENIGLADESSDVAGFAAKLEISHLLDRPQPGRLWENNSMLRLRGH
jgi:ABC-type nitrate/sulfonate/bicarbonate transport system ATPase subunit